MKANGIINFVFVTSASACLMGIVVKPKSFQKEELNLDYFNAKPILTLDTPKVKEPLHFNFNDNKNLKFDANGLTLTLHTYTARCLLQS